MASLNKFMGIGNLGRDPEMRSFPSGDQVANVSIGVTEKWRDKASGEMREHTEWVCIVFNGKLAEIAGQYLRKGSQIYVEGSLRTRKWTGQDGVEKYSTEIRADQMQMLGSRQGGGDDGHDSAPAAPARRAAPPAGRPSTAPRPPAPAYPPSSGFSDMDDDLIPF